MLRSTRRDRKWNKVVLAAALILSEGLLIPASSAQAVTDVASERPLYKMFRDGNFESDSVDKEYGDWFSHAPAGVTFHTQSVYWTKEVLEGNAAQKLTASGLKNNQPAYIYQTIAVEPDTEYFLNGYVNAQQLNNAKAQIFVEFFDENNNLLPASLQASQTEANGEYVRLRVGRITPANAVKARIYIQIRGTADGGSGTIYADNFTFRPTSYLGNGRFDRYTGVQDVADDWQFYKDPNATASTYISEYISHDGGKSQGIFGRNIPAWQSISVRQMVRAEPNTSYTVSGQFNIRDLQDAKVQLYLDYYDKDGKPISNSSVETSQVSDDDKWVELRSETVTPPNTAYIRIAPTLRATANGGSGAFYVDSISFNKTQRQYEDLVPLMTSNDSPSGRVEAYGGTEILDGYHVFDNNVETTSRVGVGFAIYGYRFEEPVVVKEYSVRPIVTQPGSGPIRLTLFGDNNGGVDGMILDDRDITVDWVSGQMQTFSIYNTTPCRNYFLQIEGANLQDQLEIAELEFGGVK